MTETVKHLYCTQCDDRVGVARLNNIPHLVCHCTHHDADIVPPRLEPPGLMLRLPDEWEYIENGDENA